MNTKKPFIITISREVGSGGHTVGKILAEKLGVRYCDKQLLEALQNQFKLTASGIEKLKGEKKSWLADFIGMIAPMPSAKTMDVDYSYTAEFRPDLVTDDIYKAEVEILNGFAQLGSCVIAGRSGFFIFKDHPNILNVFITASTPNRIDRIMKKQGLSEAEAIDVIKRIDKGRENFTKRYAGVSRYDARNYNIVLNSDGHTEEQLADLILAYIG